MITDRFLPVVSPTGLEYTAKEFRQGYTTSGRELLSVIPRERKGGGTSRHAHPRHLPLYPKQDKVPACFSGPGMLPSLAPHRTRLGNFFIKDRPDGGTPAWRWPAFCSALADGLGSLREFHLFPNPHRSRSTTEKGGVM